MRYSISYKPLLILILSIISIVGCHRKGDIVRYSNGKIHIVTNKLNNDTVDYKCMEYFQNGKLQSIFYLKNGKLNGYSQVFYTNGKIKYEGNWNNGKRIGYFQTYYNTGNLKYIVNYIPFQDTAVGRPNQILKFSPNGDTLWNQSMYYVIKKISAPNDTLKFGDMYVFDITLKGHMFSGSSFIYICNFDKDYNYLTGMPPCRDSLEMTNFSIRLAWKNYKYGKNYIRGFIENTTWSPKKSSAPSKYARIYFTDSFYVTK